MARDANTAPRRDECRFPIGMSRVCGRHKEPNQTYCAAHTKELYLRQRPRLIKKDAVKPEAGS